MKLFDRLKEIKEVKAVKKNYVKMGSIVRTVSNPNELCMVCQVGSIEYAIIGLDSANRYYEPVLIPQVDAYYDYKSSHLSFPIELLVPGKAQWEVVDY